ncbi:hypothetical protein DOTSEDRAFT_23953 [Dothistroma septosporum NZE10]|uniref:Uncharacterized protein n=1 Tax=Dothistroma septosporum (strain NZE10 / CBS 128990) TaxID=675120 RepID=N1PJY4_DOTSN|nr:hypothetical protein DOTSEDRAFT_23953 [Dothistroma septosporum NZE10]
MLSNYGNNVRAFDPRHPLNKNNPLVKRDDQVTFNPEMTPPTTVYGSANPVDVVNSLYDDCAGASCNNGPFYYTSTYVTNLGQAIGSGVGDTAGSRSLRLDPAGDWDDTDSNARSYYIESLRQVMSSNISSQDVQWVNGGSSGFGGGVSSGSVTTWTGAQYVSMSRFTNGALNGALSVKITLVTADSGECGAIIGTLGTVTGVISSIGGGFFGLLGDLICS